MNTTAQPPSDDAPAPEACFDAAWLRLRNPADARARNTGLVALAHDWLDARTRIRGGSGEAGATGPVTLRLADLGCGSGANLRYLAPRLPGPQHWRLVDHDAALLALAAEACTTLESKDDRRVDCEVRQAALHPLACDTFDGLDLVSASALIDLMSVVWLQDFANACARAGCACLVSLSVDGCWAFDGPADPDDALVREAFNAHQRRDKGVGGALGPDAAARLAHFLEAAGFVVTCAPSPWQLAMDDATDRALAHQLLAGWRAAASEQCPAEATRIAAWHTRRTVTLETAGARLEVGHVDLFARPTLAKPTIAQPTVARAASAPSASARPVSGGPVPADPVPHAPLPAGRCG